jgi:hypothetical protein
MTTTTFTTELKFHLPVVHRFLCRIRDFIALLNAERIVIETLSDKSIGGYEAGAGFWFRGSAASQSLSGQQQFGL